MARRACKISAFRADFMSAAEDPDQFLQNCIDGELFIYNNTKKVPYKILRYRELFDRIHREKFPILDKAENRVVKE